LNRFNYKKNHRARWDPLFILFFPFLFFFSLDKGGAEPSKAKKEKKRKKEKEKRQRAPGKKKKRTAETKEKRAQKKKEKNARVCGNCFERGVTCSCHFCGDARAKGRVRGDARNGDFFIRRAIDRVLVDGE
jgi:hypothetical protein